jgi:hypothetical protein
MQHKKYSKECMKVPMTVHHRTKFPVVEGLRLLSHSPASMPLVSLKWLQLRNGKVEPRARCDGNRYDSPGVRSNSLFPAFAGPAP